MGHHLTHQDIYDVGYNSGYNCLEEDDIKLSDLNREELDIFWAGYDDGWEMGLMDESVHVKGK